MLFGCFYSFECMPEAANILSEILLLMFLITIRSQSSSLWIRLLLIPIRIIVVFIYSQNNLFSGIIIILYITVFIGGLIVLLVRVARISPQEQMFYFIKIWTVTTIIVSYPFIFYKKFYIELEKNAFTPWFENIRIIILLRVLLLTLALIVLTKLIIEFKGIIRNL